MRHREQLAALAALAGLFTASACAGPPPGPAAVFDAHYHDQRVTHRLDSLALRAKLAPDEDVRAEPLGRDESTSHHVVSIRHGEVPHRHDRHDLVIVIVEGYGLMRMGRSVRAVGPGSVVYVPRGTPHAFVNGSQAPAVALAIYHPPFDGRDRAPADPLSTRFEPD